MFKNYFLLASWEMTKIAGSASTSGSASGSASGFGFISQRHGSADPDPDPDPPQNVIDLQHWFCNKSICPGLVPQSHKFTQKIMARCQMHSEMRDRYERPVHKN
jgi:hypothetical protein